MCRQPLFFEMREPDRGARCHQNTLRNIERARSRGADRRRGRTPSPTFTTPYHFVGLGCSARSMPATRLAREQRACEEARRAGWGVSSESGREGRAARQGKRAVPSGPRRRARSFRHRPRRRCVAPVSCSALRRHRDIAPPSTTKRRAPSEFARANQRAGRRAVPIAAARATCRRGTLSHHRVRHACSRSRARRCHRRGGWGGLWRTCGALVASARCGGRWGRCTSGCARATRTARRCRARRPRCSARWRRTRARCGSSGVTDRLPSP